MATPHGVHPAAAAAVLDPARLGALEALGLVGTAPEAEFDRLTALAARVAQAPVSLVALVGAETSFFKSAHGLPETPPGRAVPLSHSLCQHVVGTGEPLVIGDARAHPLVQNNGGVTDLGVGAYLGVPVRAPSGHVVGSLCAIDHAPRTWTADDRTSLVTLAASVEGEIALREQLAERERAEALARAEAEALAIVVGVNATLAAGARPGPPRAGRRRRRPHHHARRLRRLLLLARPRGRLGAALRRLRRTARRVRAVRRRPDDAALRAVVLGARGSPV